MSFISFEFLIFLIAIYIIYFAVGRIAPKYQWVVLLAASYIFYSFATNKFILFLLLSTVTTWIFPLLTHKYPKLKDLFLTICLVINIGILFTLKYTGFLFELFGRNLEYHFILPLGISFYTFQSLGYCIDIYRGKMEPEKNFFKYALFVAYFPQICQGPIGKFENLMPQFLECHKFEYLSFKRGLIRIVEGFFKKVVIADTLAVFVDVVYSNYFSYSGITLLIASIFYTFQIYADFSGYMDIVIGCSNCFGISLRENFTTPYLSSSITEFWKSWHISLTSWFRDYLYIPLGGNRKGIVRKYLNKLIVFLVSGLWHGADLSFVLWGGIHGTLLIGEELIGFNKQKNTSKVKKFFRVLLTFMFINIAWIFFRADSIDSAFQILKTIFTNSQLRGFTGELFSISAKYYYFAALFAVVTIILFDILERDMLVADRIIKQKLAIQWIILYLFLLFISFTLILSTGQTANAANFIYFNF